MDTFLGLRKITAVTQCPKNLLFTFQSEKLFNDKIKVTAGNCPGKIGNRPEIEFSFSSLGQKVDKINVSAGEQYGICHVVYFAFNLRFKLKIRKLSARFARPCGLFGA